MEPLKCSWCDQGTEFFFSLINIKMWQDWTGQIGKQYEKVIDAMVIEFQGSGVRDKAMGSRCVGSTGEKAKEP